MSDDSLDELARSTVSALVASSNQFVLAESCTAGLISATLARVPGVSEVLCGSAVVYQVETKSKWLNVNSGILDDPGPVSEEVAVAMATAVLDQTPQATIALSITGHLGPDAPSELDGTAWIAIAARRASPTSVHLLLNPGSEEAAQQDLSTLQIRLARQRDAVSQSLEFVIDWVQRA